MSDSVIDVNVIAREVLEQEARNREALKYLLDYYLEKGDCLIAEKTMMGGTEAFVASVSLQWLSERLGFAAQLPLFRDKIDPLTQKITIDESTISLIQQRPLYWNRQAALAQYLAARPAHKFPPILAVITYSWVDNPKADEWDAQGKAIRSAVEFSPLDSKGKIGLLDVSEKTSIYALDGQHRLMGVKGLMQLLQTGFLPRRQKDGREERTPPISKEELTKLYGVSDTYLQTLKSEHIGVEFITAVVQGETREEARRRVRSIFVHVNRMAAPLTQGQLDLLNEDDGFSIVARLTGTEHKFLKNQERDLVEWEKSNLTDNSSQLTTLETLREMAEKYLAPREEYKRWRPLEEGLIPLRPEDEQLETGLKEFMNLWDLLSTLPSYAKLEQGAAAGDLRRFSDGRNPGQGHMLFRPVGQEALAGALGTLVGVKGQDIEVLFKKLRKFDNEGGFKLDDVSSVWFMVLYDPNKQRMVVRGLTLAQRLLEYLLGGGIPEEQEREKLRKDLAEARTFHMGARTRAGWRGEEGKAISYSGQWGSPSDIDLPPVIRI